MSLPNDISRCSHKEYPLSCARKEAKIDEYSSVTDFSFAYFSGRGCAYRIKLLMRKMKSDKEIFGLSKIPDSAVISQLRSDLGAANSYIQELEFRLSGADVVLELSAKVKALENDNASLRGSLMALRGSDVEARHRAALNAKSKEIINLRKTVSELVYRLNKYEKL